GVPVAESEGLSIVAVLPPLLPAIWSLRDASRLDPDARASVPERALLLEALELGRDRLDACGHLPALRLPFALFPLERGELVQESARVLTLEPGLRVGQPLLELFALVLELGGAAAKLGDEPGGALHALREAIEIGGDYRGFVHARSLSWPPQRW